MEQNLHIIIPTFYFFYIDYPIRQDLRWTKNHNYIIPGMYATTILFTILKTTIKQYSKDKNKDVYYIRLLMFFAMLFWSLGPFLGIIAHAPPWIVSCWSNFNFIILNIFNLNLTIKRYRAEYLQLQESNISLTEKVKDRTLQLEKANEEKSNTFINLMHEIKTPVTLMYNYLDEYLKTGITKDLEIVATNMSKIIRDISNLFAIERWEKGLYIHNHNQLSNFSKILNDNIDLFEKAAQRRNIQIIRNITDGIVITSDPIALDEIIKNIIDNSIKYGIDGGRTEVSLIALIDMVQFIVKDNGIGIPTQLNEKIFDTFYQINNHYCPTKVGG